MTKLFRAKHINWQNRQHFLKLLNNMYFKSMFRKKQNNLWTIIIFFKHTLQSQYLRRKIVTTLKKKSWTRTHFMSLASLSIQPENNRKPLHQYIFRGYRKRPMAWNGLMRFWVKHNCFRLLQPRIFFWWLNQRRIQDPVKHLRWTVLRK